eukprot:m.134648 g.134648  ORF g.134648 m.134648 type:complete len:922 (-) comp11396_c0_seq1:189-2954(-)
MWARTWLGILAAGAVQCILQQADAAPRPVPPAVSDTWDYIGPWNLFDDVDNKGEAGTLACAASPAQHPDIIYAGGQNNGASSGVIKTTDGGRTWKRMSNGLWDTAVLATWVHPDDETGNHVLAGTHSGIYESHDGADSWVLLNETQPFGYVMSFRQGTIGGTPYILANAQHGILTQPYSGGTWQQIQAPGPIAPNAHLSLVETDGVTEVVTCIGGWGGGDLYYAKIESATNATWTGPIKTANQTFTTWDFFPNESEIWARCKTPTSCDPDIRVLGQYATLPACQAAVNQTSETSAVAWYTYQHNVSGNGAYAAYCYVGSTFSFAPTAQQNVDSGRAPGVFPGLPIDCANAVVDPADRNHILYSKGGQYRAWESHDGGATVAMIENATQAAYFVMIDSHGWYYTSTQPGTFVSTDKGSTWNPLHAIMHSKDGRVVDRVPHDFQRIVPDFRGDGIALPSDQGLHILNRSSTTFELINAIGDMTNAIALSALISPNANGSRNLVVNMWDWNVVASWDDGASWAGWEPNEKSPGGCGEGGGGQAMGASGHLVMFHHSNWWYSSDGGHNFVQNKLPDGGSVVGFDYVRQAGSRSEPNGTCFALLSAPPSSLAHTGGGVSSSSSSHGGHANVLRRLGDEPDCRSKNTSVTDAWCQQNCPETCPPSLCSCDNDDDDDETPVPSGRGYEPDAADGKDPRDGDHDIDINDMDPYNKGPQYTSGIQPTVAGNINYLMVSDDFGAHWNVTSLPSEFQVGWLTCDPTDPSTLYGLTPNCLRRSTNRGHDWSNCINGSGLSGTLSKFLIKDAQTWFVMRRGAVPLRTRDGGATWEPLQAAAPLYKYGASFDGTLSWSGKTLVLSGFDGSAIQRHTRGTSVWKSVDDGETFTDETGDIVTNSPGGGVWFDTDFYLPSGGTGVMVKRDFDHGQAGL